MTTSVSLPLSSARPVPKSDVRHDDAPPPRTLCAVGLGVEVKVVALELDEELGAWLRAVGIGEGERLVVLRRAVFGGPIHVRTGAGGEFALNRSLARSIAIRLAAAGDDAEETAA